MAEACPMVMGRNGGVRQHRVASDGCKWNPLALQKWLQIFEGVISSSWQQMVVQHCDLGRLALDDAGRRGGQTLGIL